MFKRSLRLFELWGIPVEIHISWILIFILVTWSFATGVYPESYGGTFSSTQLWIISFLTAVLLFLSILLHEFSHSVVAIRNGLPIGKITLFMFGGVAQMRREVESPSVELKMASAGPAMTLVLIGVYYLLGVIFRSFDTLFVLFNSLAFINGAILVFNMIPGFPLDGGRILRAVIWRKTGNLLRATKTASRIGKGFAFFLIGMGIISFLVKGNLIDGIWLMIIGTFLRQAAERSYKAVIYREVMERFKVSDIVRYDVVTVGLSVDLRTLVEDYFKKHPFQSFPVVEDGVLVGIIRLDDVKKVERGKWPEIKTADLVNRNISDYAIRAFDNAGKLLRLIQEKKYDSFPVIDDYGRFTGIVTRSDFEEAVRVMTSIRNLPD